MFYTYFRSFEMERYLTFAEQSHANLEIGLPGLRQVGYGYVWDAFEGETEMQGVARFRQVLEAAGTTKKLFPYHGRVSFLTPILLYADHSRWAPESLIVEHIEPTRLAVDKLVENGEILN